MKEKKLVITGMGAVTPIGIGVAAYWESLMAGKCGVGPITRFDASGLAVRIAAEVEMYDPAKYLPKNGRFRGAGRKRPSRRPGPYGDRHGHLNGGDLHHCSNPGRTDPADP